MVNTHYIEEMYMPEGTDIVIEAPKGFVTVERSVQVRPYETAKCSLMLQIPTSPGATVEDIISASKDSFYTARTIVLEQLGIPFDISAENIVTERFTAALGAVEVTPKEEAQAVANSNTSRPTGGNAPPSTKDELWAELASNPSQWWDNRNDKRNAKAPDFKRKGNGEQPALWVEFNGKSVVPDGIVIPASGFAQRKAA